MINQPTQEELQKQFERKKGEIQLRGEEDLAKKLAQGLGLPYINLKIYPVNPAALKLVEENKARAGQLAVISKNGSNLKIAVRNPSNPETQVILEDLRSKRFILGFVISSLQGLESAWEKYDTFKKPEKVQLGIVALGEEQILKLQDEIKNISDLKNNLSKLRITDIVDVLLAGALKIGASDIHFEPEENELRIRYRIDGILADIADLPNKEYPKFLSRIKLISKLKINIHDVPQDGRFTIRLKGKDVEIRVSVLPGAYGENIVMRLLDPESISQKMEDLGIRKDLLELIKKELKDQEKKWTILY